MLAITAGALAPSTLPNLVPIVSEISKFVLEM